MPYFTVHRIASAAFKGRGEACTQAANRVEGIPKMARVPPHVVKPLTCDNAAQLTNKERVARSESRPTIFSRRGTLSVQSTPSAIHYNYTDAFSSPLGPFSRHSAILVLNLGFSYRRQRPFLAGYCIFSGPQFVPELVCTIPILRALLI